MRHAKPPLVFRALAGALSGLALLLSGCGGEEGPNQVTVVGIDYAFEAPDTLPPGPTAFTFENRGQVPHEMILVRLREGATLEQVREAVQSGGDPFEYMEGGPGILIASAGETAASRLLVDLVPGRTYTLVCNFQDEPDAPPHTALGMRSSFQVAAAEG